jgi:hypothetical protein
MCCPLIFYREEIIRGVEGPNKMPRKNKRWHDGRVRKECNIGDTMLINSSNKKSFKQEEKITISHLPFITGCHRVPMMKVIL